MDGSSEGLPEPGDSRTMVCAAEDRVGAAPHREAGWHPCVVGPSTESPQALFDETAEGLHGEGAARASGGEDKKARPARGPGSVSALRAGGLRDDDLDTTVLLAARSGIVLSDRIVLAPANCLEAVCVYTLADQVLHHRIGPAL